MRAGASRYKVGFIDIAFAQYCARGGRSRLITHTFVWVACPSKAEDKTSVSMVAILMQGTQSALVTLKHRCTRPDTRQLSEPKHLCLLCESYAVNLLVSWNTDGLNLRATTKWRKCLTLNPCGEKTQSPTAMKCILLNKAWIVVSYEVNVTPISAFEISGSEL